jgi:hypothetical protein
VACCILKESRGTCTELDRIRKEYSSLRNPGQFAGPPFALADVPHVNDITYFTLHLPMLFTALPAQPRPRWVVGILVGTLFLFIMGVPRGHAAPPTVLSATVSSKEAVVFGGRQRYAVYELDLDQPLYYQENWPCPCLTAPGLGNCTTGGRTAGAGVNTTGYNVTPLPTDGSYLTVESNFTDVHYFSLQLDPNSFSHCPIVALELQSFYGQAQLMGSTRAIPTLSNREFYKYQLQRDAIWVCPSDLNFAWGTWYLAVQNTPPVTLRNAFRIRYFIVNPTAAQSCPAPPGQAVLPPGVTRPTVADDWTLMEDGVGNWIVLPLLEYHYFRFYPGTQCSDFSVSARQVDVSLEGDVDLYVSLSDPHTALETTYDWAAYINYDDALSLRSVCRSSAAAPIYVSTQTWKALLTPLLKCFMPLFFRYSASGLEFCDIPFL